MLGLRNMASVCDDLLLLETMVCDSDLPVLRLDDESTSVNQALRGVAHRPSPSYLALALNHIGFDHVYAASTPPDHADYRFARVGDLAPSRDGALLRGVFVAHAPLWTAPRSRRCSWDKACLPRSGVCTTSVRIDATCPSRRRLKARRSRLPTAAGRRLRRSGSCRSRRAGIRDSRGSTRHPGRAPGIDTHRRS